MQKLLFDTYRIRTVWRTGVAAGSAIRVGHDLYTPNANVDALAKALRAEQNMFG